MTLAEALIKRKEIKSEIDKITTLVSTDNLVIEGEESDSPISLLLVEWDSLYKDHEYLVKAINNTNNQTLIIVGATASVLSQAIAYRDTLVSKIRDINTIKYSFNHRSRKTKDELKYVPQVPKSYFEKIHNDYTKELRELDVEIQKLNWTTELIES